MTGFSSVGRACDCRSLAILLICSYHKVGGSNPPTRNKIYYLFIGNNILKRII